MPEQFGEKQHAPSAFRRQKAREEGQVAKSQDLTSAILLICGTCAILAFGDRIVLFMGEYTKHQIGEAAWLSINSDFVVSEWYVIVRRIGFVLFPILGVLFVAAVLSNLGQVGFLFIPKRLAPDITKLDPLKGLKRLFSLSNTMRLSFGIFKLLIVATVACWCLWTEKEEILGLSALTPIQIAPQLIQIVLWTTLKIGMALLILAILDYAWQRWKHEEELRMTTQEVRDEAKALQGNPQMAARRKAVQRQLAMNRIESDVAKSQLAVTNPTELAIAIQYDIETMDAPIVAAKGAGAVAKRIRRIALENDIPVIERKELARALYKRVEVGSPIPPDLYAAMAEVLRYVYELKGQTPSSLQRAA